MGWQGTLALRYRLQAGRTVVHDRHHGPLRVLRSLHPEGPGICHSVIVHPPGGVVGGDQLALAIEVESGAHALLTTPGATRFYRSAGASARQSVTVRAADGARVEWLPQESIAYSGCLAENTVHFDLAPGAEMMGWDITALGLPASNAPFVDGRFVQAVEAAGRWRERGIVRGSDQRLLTSPLGWAGHSVLATLWFAAGGDLSAARRERLLDLAREQLSDDPLQRTAAATAPCDEVVVVRALASRVEPVARLLARIRVAWRHAAWQLGGEAPRIWST